VAGQLVLSQNFYGWGYSCFSNRRFASKWEYRLM